MLLISLLDRGVGGGRTRGEKHDDREEERENEERSRNGGVSWFLQPLSLSLGVFPSAEPFRLERGVVLVGRDEEQETPPPGFTRVSIGCELHKTGFYSAEAASEVTHRREAHLPYGIFRDASDDSAGVLRRNLNWSNN